MLSGPTGLAGGDGLHEVVVAAAGSAAYGPFLLDLAGTDSARLEEGLAASLADSLLDEWFSGAGRTDAATTFDGSAYQVPDGGLAILPYASSDLEVSAQVVNGGETITATCHYSVVENDTTGRKQAGEDITWVMTFNHS